MASDSSPQRLSDIGPSTAASVMLQAVPPVPQTTPYDPAQDREKLRGRLALALIRTLVAIVVGSFVIAIATHVSCALYDACSEETTKLATLKSLLEAIFAPMIGLVGAVVGFYFGEKSGKST